MGNVENKLRVEDSSIHDWYRFVLSFPPHLVQQYLETYVGNYKNPRWNAEYSEKI